MTVSMSSVLHVSASDIQGGAARAGYRVHRSLVDNFELLGVQSKLRVIQKLTDDPTVIGGPPVGQNFLWTRLSPRLTHRVWRGFGTGNTSLHSIAWPDTGLSRELQQARRQGIDLIQLHWLGSATLSIEEIGRLPQPVVWRLPDQWAFCGAEHYTSPPAPGESESSDERYILGYPSCSRPAHESGPDLNRLTWRRKQRAWRQPMQIVCTTAWLADCAQRSALMRDWPITVIPNPLDLRAFAPIDQGQARALLQLPPDRPLVLFGAINGTADFRKGSDLLFEAMQRLHQQVTCTTLEDIELIVFGQAEPVQALELGFPVHYMGHLNDDISLRLLYAAADVMVVPSRQEAFGQTASEAHACGTPVVAFRTGGLVDIVKDRITGALAEPFDQTSLADAIHWVLENPQRRRLLGASARQRAEQLWHPARVAGMYAEVYRQALDSHRQTSLR